MTGARQQAFLWLVLFIFQLFDLTILVRAHFSQEEHDRELIEWTLKYLDGHGKICR